MVGCVGVSLGAAHDWRAIRSPQLRYPLHFALPPEQLAHGAHVMAFAAEEQRTAAAPVANTESPTERGVGNGLATPADEEAPAAPAQRSESLLEVRFNL